METTYNPKQLEAHWQQHWQKTQLGTPSGHGTAYCIMLPPPNVTGTLHMGHGFQHTLMDALIRYHRMLGDNTLWQGGTDHAGIATQMVVERQLAQQNQTRHDLGREKFVERIWQWRHESGNSIINQMGRLGLSLDWSRLRFSLDEGMSKATYEAFSRLYKEGLIYRGKRLVNWDPVLQTAISDLEVETEQVSGTLWHIRYPLCDSDQYVVIATTRPETMLGDAAVAVHPDDARYQALIGKKIKLPLVGREIPIIGDDYVDKEFGSGCVKITPAHDFNDNEMGKRHKLPEINIFTASATINDNAPEKYRGLDRFAARKLILADLNAQNLLEKEQPHLLSLPRGERSNAIIEPYLTDQWFVNAKELAQPALKALETGELNFIPEAWQKTYRQWLENIQDWCISRQLWWGHRIPVWYDDNHTIYVGHNENEIRQKHNLPQTLQLTQDNDVLDTWFSASLWPFATLGWPDKTAEFKTFYPSNVLVTGFDIIFFWVARMVMMGIKLTGQVPFKHVYVTGLIRDRHGKKMSKSKGNVLDPIDLIDGIDLASLIEKRTHGLMQPKMREQVAKQTREEFANGIPAFGTDALRFTFCALANTGRDINFDMGRIEGYRNFCNKLWNAARFVLMNVEGEDIDAEKPLQFSLADEWIQSRLQRVIETTTRNFTDYRFDLLAQSLYEFVWNEYCDWYLELAKCVLNNPNAKPSEKRGTRVTLIEVLEQILRLLHPITPYITEEIWQRVSPLVGTKAKSIALTRFPSVNTDCVNQDAETAIAWLQKIVVAVRTIRSEMNVSPNKKIPLIFNKGSQQDKLLTTALVEPIRILARIENTSWCQNENEIAATAAKIIDTLEVHIPLTDLIDKQDEIARLQKEINKLDQEIVRSQTKLNNDSYVAKAPVAVVENERSKLNQAQHAKQQLEANLTRIQSL